MEKLPGDERTSPDCCAALGNPAAPQDSKIPPDQAKLHHCTPGAPPASCPAFLAHPAPQSLLKVPSAPVTGWQLPGAEGSADTSGDKVTSGRTAWVRVPRAPHACRGHGVQGDPTLTIMRSCRVTPVLRRSRGKGLMVTAAMAWPAPGNSRRRVTATCRSTLGLYCSSSTNTARLLQGDSSSSGAGTTPALGLLSGGTWILCPCDTVAAALRSPGDSRTLPLPLPHSHVVDPRVLLQEFQLSPALLQGRAQLLHVATAVVEGDVAPVPDPAEEEEPWGRLKGTGCSPTWQARIKCADADPALQDLFHKTDYRGALIHPRTAPSPVVAPDLHGDASGDKPERKPSVIDVLPRMQDNLLSPP